MTTTEMDDWLLACAADPSIVTPAEMGYLPAAWREMRAADEVDQAQ